MVFKKDLTPIGGPRGQIVKHKGKGSSRPPPRPVMDQLTRRYPKPAPAPAPAPMAPAPVAAPEDAVGMGPPPLMPPGRG